MLCGGGGLFFVCSFVLFVVVVFVLGGSLGAVSFVCLICFCFCWMRERERECVCV